MKRAIIFSLLVAAVTAAVLLPPASGSGASSREPPPAPGFLPDDEGSAAENDPRGLDEEEDEEEEEDVPGMDEERSREWDRDASKLRSLRPGRRMKDQSVVSGDTVKFTCRVSTADSQEPIAIEWWSGTSRLDPRQDGRISIEMRSWGSRLKIVDVYTSDGGEYVCVARTRHHVVRHRATLRVSFKKPPTPANERPISVEHEAKCAPYQGSACSSFFNGSLVYSDPDADGLMQEVMAAKISQLVDELRREMVPGGARCVEHIMPAYCAFMFPACAVDQGGVAVPRIMCREDCETVRDRLCHFDRGLLTDSVVEDLQKMKSAVNCSDLPSSGEYSCRSLDFSSPESGEGSGEEEDEEEEVDERPGSGEGCRECGDTVWFLATSAAAAGAILVLCAFVFWLVRKGRGRMGCGGGKAAKLSYRSQSFAFEPCKVQLTPTTQPLQVNISSGGSSGVPLLGADALYGLGEVVGAGQHGVVYRATLRSPIGNVSHVVAQPVAGFRRMSESGKDELWSLVSRRHRLRHPNVTRLLGVVGGGDAGDALCPVYEYADAGAPDLRAHLRSLRHHRYDVSKLVAVALQVAHGMAHMESHGYVHGRLTSRHVVRCAGDEAADGTLKVVTFDLGRDDDEDAVTAPEGWISPESSQFASSKIDVFSFGTLLWEIFSLGAVPRTGQDLPLTCPANCPQDVYKLMVACWNREPSARPSFQDIVTRLSICKKEFDISVSSTVVPSFAPPPSYSTIAPTSQLAADDVMF